MTINALPFDLRGKRIFVAGHTGMAGSAIIRRLRTENVEVLTIGHRELDLARQEPTEKYLCKLQPDIVVVAAGKVGGIIANSAYPVEFLADNLSIELNIIRGSYSAGVQKLLFLGSSCIYPKFAKQPMTEDQLLTGELEPTNEWYAIAKITGIKLCQAYRQQHNADFISVIPTNLYGQGDNYHPEHSHVVAALIRRFHEAKQAKSSCVAVWGSGTPRREFLYVDDFADACIFVLKNYSSFDFINIGYGRDITIAEFAKSVAEVVGYTGQIIYDRSKPDGTPVKLLDVSRLSALGWKAKTSLLQGLEIAYGDFLKGSLRER
jgi:GDP-L-fucose synthase